MAKSINFGVLRARIPYSWPVERRACVVPINVKSNGTETCPHAFLPTAVASSRSIVLTRIPTAAASTASKIARAEDIFSLLRLLERTANKCTSVPGRNTAMCWPNNWKGKQKISPKETRYFGQKPLMTLASNASMSGIFTEITFCAWCVCVCVCVCVCGRARADVRACVFDVDILGEIPRFKIDELHKHCVKSPWHMHVIQVRTSSANQVAYIWPWIVK